MYRSTPDTVWQGIYRSVLPEGWMALYLGCIDTAQAEVKNHVTQVTVTNIHSYLCEKICQLLISVSVQCALASLLPSCANFSFRQHRGGRLYSHRSDQTSIHDVP